MPGIPTRKYACSVVDLGQTLDYRHWLKSLSFWVDGATSALLAHLVGLQFIAARPGELSLDDVELVGCRMEDVYPELGP